MALLASAQQDESQPKNVGGLRPTVEHAGTSVQGPVRSNNEDFIAYEMPDDAALRAGKGLAFVVADGVGGSDAGEVASREAARALISSYYQSRKRPDAALRDAFQHANHRIFDLSHGEGGGYRRMETTLTGFVLVGGWVHVGNVGDSRLYRVRPGTDEVTQLTRDHSEVAELVRMGIVTPEEARHHPRRNVITRSVGSQFAVQAEFCSEPVLPGDVFVLCTDGLWEPLESRDIAEIIRCGGAEECCRRLTELALQRETNDNLSVQVVKVLELEDRAGGPQGRPAASGSVLSRALSFFERRGRRARGAADSAR